MYLEKESDRIRTVLSGTPLSAEKIRMAGSSLGAEWFGTSWYFLEHLLAKEFTRSTKIPFDAIHSTVVNYGITRWTDRDNLRSKLKTMMDVFDKSGLGNVHFDHNGALEIDGLLSKNEFRNFAARQYQHSMTEGLLRYSSDYEGWLKRKPG